MRPDPLRVALVLVLVVALVVVAAATGCQAPRPGYGVPR